jgi:hypothetical protein
MVFEIKNRYIIAMLTMFVIVAVVGVINYNKTYDQTVKELQYGNIKSEVVDIDVVDNDMHVWNFEININYYKRFDKDRFILLLTKYIKKLQYSIRDNKGYLESDLEVYFVSKMPNIGNVSIESLECYNDLFVEVLKYDRGKK